MEAPLQQRIKPSLVVRGIAECVHFKRSPHFFLSRPFCALCSCRKGIVLFLPPSDFLHHSATSLASLISCHASTPDNFSRLLSGRCHPSTRCGRAVGPLGKADLLQAIIVTAAATARGPSVPSSQFTQIWDILTSIQEHFCSFSDVNILSLSPREDFSSDYRSKVSNLDLLIKKLKSYYEVS